MKKLILAERTILAALAAAIFFFDVYLELGSFHGLVFSIYLTYASIALFLVNAAISLVFAVKKETERAKRFIVTGVALGLAGTIIAYSGGRLIGTLY